CVVVLCLFCWVVWFGGVVGLCVVCGCFGLGVAVGWVCCGCWFFGVFGLGFWGLVVVGGLVLLLVVGLVLGVCVGVGFGVLLWVLLVCCLCWWFCWVVWLEVVARWGCGAE
ncbi:hypothetical protein, partial [Pseudomonas syringae group genomosp. 7]|uniref:hypothetical protein n=1 Tax=Pseudomonas syringae group genomosp. 7 TaxID=251699 RepID=UPI00376FE0A9